MSSLLKNKFFLPVVHILAGIIYALNFPFIGKFTIFPTIFLSAAVLFYGLKSENRFKHNLLNIFLFCWGYNFAGYYWLTFTLNEFGNLFFPFNFILWQLFSVIIAPQFYLFLITFFFLKKHVKINTLAGGVLYSLIFVALEYFTPQQFPALFGHPWLKISPFLKPARLLGVPFYSFLSLFIGHLIFMFYQKQRLPKAQGGIILALLLVNFGVGPIKAKVGDDLKIRIVQGNIGNDLKLKSEQGLRLASSEVINIYKDLSLADGVDDIDLVIWPETSYPRFVFSRENKKLAGELMDLFVNSEASYFFGTYDLASTNPSVLENTYNATILSRGEGIIDQVYHKQVLIPFGEGLPFGPLNKYLAPHLTNISFFASGTKYTNFEVKNKNFISLICYEVLFPRYVGKYIKEVKKRGEKIDFIVNVTNDSWYGPYSEQEQHLFLAKWRAVEFNLPIIRATNTGISAVIKQDGRELIRTENFKQEIKDFSL
ncbi:apolipoprotein N-acyltransferase [Halobacteriovorax sp. HFRX-2_2]|uniref:apolipoprotein N-acyltransferase n=1 Tax=unclassified Halobacteriovorax TaxID=2639665 RepID=UPI003718889B